MDKKGKAYGTQRELAELLSITPSAVNQHIKNGVIKLSKGGRVHLQKAMSAYQENVNQAQQRPFRGTDQSASTGESSKVFPEKKKSSDIYNEARAEREVEEAAMARMKREEMEGKLLDAEKLKPLYANGLTTLRNNILAIGRRLAPSLVGLSDENVIADKIYQESELALLSASEHAFEGM